MYLTLSSSNYPKLLKECKDAPAKLYYKGEINDSIFENCLAVVGSRKISAYGREVLRILIPYLARKGITVVSGLAYGVDIESHREVLKSTNKNLNCIVVMPCGIDRVEPKHNIITYRSLLNRGSLILSEYPDTHPSFNWTYPRRNRIIAGLSKAVLIIEAEYGSGTMLTAQQAIRYGRKVFSVPGPITSPTSEGTNLLISEGATLVKSPSQISDFFNLGSENQVLKQPFTHFEELTIVQNSILEKIHMQTMSFDQLKRDLKEDASTLSSTLSILEIGGYLNQKKGRYYVD
jgi:DNA processing protein